MRKRTYKMESTRKTVKDSVFFLSGQRQSNRDVTRADVARQMERARMRRMGTSEGAWRRWSARVRVAGEPESFGGAWGRVQGWIRPILVAMDRS